MRTHLARIEETRTLAGRAAQAVLDPDARMLDAGLYSTVGPPLLAPALEAFSAIAADVELVLYDVWGPKAYDLLLSGAFDCAIVARQAQLPARVEAVQLTTEQMVIGASARLSLTGRTSMQLRELSGQVYLDRLRCEFREPISGLMKHEGITPVTRPRSESDAWILHAVAMGEGVTIGPRSILDTPGVIAIDIEDAVFERPIDLITVTGRALSPVARRFVDCIAGFDWTRYSAA
ncbi:MAG: LysR family transcriptional regulator substrate-binding protein [Pseudomonadota bacterium]